jgi:hypothetical protein
MEPEKLKLRQRHEAEIRLLEEKYAAMERALEVQYMDNID